MTVATVSDTVAGRKNIMNTPVPSSQLLLVLVVVVGSLIAMATSIDASTPPEEERCGLWLGPSPIKEGEDHGWGHSIFTGKHIEKGTVVLGSGIMDGPKTDRVFGDLFVPVYDWEKIDMGLFAQWDDDWDATNDGKTDGNPQEKVVFKEALKEYSEMEPPLFHQLWSGDIYKTTLLESEEGMRAFIPGLSTICPCTWKNFNLEQTKRVTYRDWRDIKGDSHDETPPSPQAGSFSYLSNAMFIAARDILPGEELVVECSDNSDNFNPGDYGPTKFEPREAGGYSICLDDKVEERLADHTPNVAANASYGGQRGLFAKRSLKKDEILTSTPMIPVHQEEMTMDRAKYAKFLEDADAHGNVQKIGIPAQKKQLLENYIYGHAESSLMWLATAPLLHSVNHAPHDQTSVQPNAKIQWHKTDIYSDAAMTLSRRQRFHHAELLEMDSREVVLKHGMGLMLDLVALRDIGENEEILIDYGKAWDDAWKEHNKIWDATVDAIKAGHAAEKLEWKQQRKKEREERERDQKLDSPRAHKKHRQRHVENAMTALPLSSYVTASDYNDLYPTQNLRTVSEQRRKPYPSNIETACYFDDDWIDTDTNEDEGAEEITFMSWYQMTDRPDSCLLPCIITERRDYIDREEAEVNDDDNDEFIDRNVESQPNGGSATTKRYTAKLIDNHEENTSIDYDCHLFKRFEYYVTDIPREGIVFVNKLHSSDQWIDQAFRQPIGLPDEMVPMSWRDLTRRKGMRGGQTKRVAPLMTREEAEKEVEYLYSVKKWNEADSRGELLEDSLEKRQSSSREDL